MFSKTSPAKQGCCQCLHGILRVGRQRNFSFPLEKFDVFLASQVFWRTDTLLFPVTEEGANLTEVFTIINNNKFLETVQNNFLIIEIAKPTKTIYPEILGLSRLPLHQFFIAYRDASLTNRLKSGQFPVISIDKWVPVMNSSGEKIGEIECLLAMGTQKQIENLKNSRIWKTNEISYEIPPDQLHIANKNTSMKFLEGAIPLVSNTKLGQTSDLFNMLQKSLAFNPFEICPSDLESNSFRIHLEIKSARNLPKNQPLKFNKKKLNKTAGFKGRHVRIPPEEGPNTYVTFQANEGDGPMVKSHEGMVYSTGVSEKTSNPVWNMSFCVSGAITYLTNKNEKFILKVWKKVNKNEACDRNLPCPMEDAIIGFASVDLTNLIADVPLINEWFDIVDFSGHVNGEINIIAKPFHDVTDLKERVRKRKENQVENLLDTFESSLDINNTNLSRAIKRKFTELEEISERLRVRLLDVTGSLDDSNDTRDISDEQLDEFEHDLNTIACEDESESISSHINRLNTSQHSPSTK